ncbi:MAG: pyrroline-5-carboxylate reductase [Bacteroidota bacterium]
MLADQTLAILGAGNIGRALIGGLLRGGDVAPEQIRATRRNPYALDALREQFPGIRAGTNNAEAVRDASVVVFAVKPQNFDAVVASVREVVGPDTLVLTILAGVTTDTICAALDQSLPVVRAMPNTPALVDEGATAIAPGEYATDAHLAVAKEIFAAVGPVVEVLPEYLMDAVTGLSGSGPAYIYMVIEALTDGGVKMGLPRPQALKLAAQTVYGAAKLVLETGMHPAILRDQVTTPGGTTIAAIAELERHGLRPMLIEAVGTATARSQALRKREE